MARPGQSYEPPLFSWNVGSIVEDLCARAGLPNDRYETALLEGYVEGFSTTSEHSAASAIEVLAGMFLFDPSNHSGMLHFVPRGEAPVRDIPLEDLVGDSDVMFEVKRKDTIMVPRVINLEYYDTEGGLTADKQTSDRTLDERSKAESTTQTTVIMRADDAARSVVVSHKIAIEELRGEVKFSLPMGYLDLTTADIITINGARLRITEIEIDDIQQNYTCLYDRLSAYESTIQGVPIDQPSEAPGLVIADTALEIIESPIIQDADDQLGFYVAIAGLSNNWTGAAVEMSIDGGANWTDGGGLVTTAVMGTITSDLPAHSLYYPDRHNSVTVELLRPDFNLTPATFAEMLSRANLAIIGNELVNFGDVEQLDETTWRISTFLRGRKGTAPVAHTAGERFVMMDTAGVALAPAERFHLGRELTFRVTSFGLEPTTETVTIIFQGVSQRERQPAYLKARRVGSDLVVSWQGVGRLGGGVNIGMGQYFQGYRVTLGATTWDTTAQTLTVPYAAGTLSVVQMNSITGAGPATSVTV